MVTVWNIRNRASPQELQSQELGERKAVLERGRESLHSPSVLEHNSVSSVLHSCTGSFPPTSQHSPPLTDKLRILGILGMLTSYYLPQMMTRFPERLKLFLPF